MEYITILETHEFELRVADNCEVELLVDRSFDQLDENIFTFNTNDDVICKMEYSDNPMCAVFKTGGKKEGHELQIWKLIDGVLEFICRYETDRHTMGTRPRTITHTKDTLCFMIGYHQIDFNTILASDFDGHPIGNIPDRLSKIF